MRVSVGVRGEQRRKGRPSTSRLSSWSSTSNTQLTTHRRASQGRPFLPFASMGPWKQATSILTTHASARADWAPSCKAWVFRNAASSRAPGLGFRWDRGKIAVMSNQRSVDPLAGDEGRGSKDDLPHPLLCLLAAFAARWSEWSLGVLLCWCCCRCRPRPREPGGLTGAGWASSAGWTGPGQGEMMVRAVLCAASPALVFFFCFSAWQAWVACSVSTHPVP